MGNRVLLRCSLLVAGLLGLGMLAHATDTPPSEPPPNPPPPEIEIEKATNGVDADDEDAGDAPQIAPGDPVTWTYVVTNTGEVTLFNVEVTDPQLDRVICFSSVLEPRDSFTCVARGIAELLVITDPNTVEGKCGNLEERPLYENLGKVVAIGPSGQDVQDTDPSHYCNPGPDIDIEKATNGVDADDPNAGDAPQIAPGDMVTWTYVVTNTGNVPLVNVQVADDQGVMVSCPQTTLAVDETITCTASGFAEDLDNTGFTTVPGLCGGVPDRPLYENKGTATGETASGEFVEDEDPSHYCNPEPPPCGLTVEKSCEIPPPPAPPEGKCDGKLQEFTVIWNGPGPIAIALGDGLTGSSQTSAVAGDEVTFFTDGSTNDTIVNISGAVSGQSTFHVSCSDEDMDGDTTTDRDQAQVSPLGRDCGKDQGDGKSKSGFINQWLLEGFVDNSNAVLDCTSDPGPGVASCEFQAVAADCDFPVTDPDILTFRVSGGDCSASDNDQKPDKTECTGDFINAALPVEVSVNGEPRFTLQPGETFDIERGGDPEIELFQGAASQFNKFHASCSQPLQAGDKYGANELLLMDGNGLGTNVVYSYLVSNSGPDDLTGITVTDDPLGPVPGSPIESLAEGASETLTATAFLTQTTTNTARAVASPTCAADSNPVLVTVSPPPPCDASIAFKELKDDTIKWTLSNDSTERKATMETFTLVFPAAYGLIKEVKLDGAIFKASDSLTYPNGIASGQTIGPDDWTEAEVAKRQLDRGESRTLEVKFTGQSKDFGQGDFDLTVTFEEDCMVTF